ncbi:MAG: hypothetical protein Q7J68_03290 [Thermoplasmata archaeon]|nr:hypothetical protein [Thermoplasmata archaeon]
MAYLHSSVFTPNEAVMERYGLSTPYYIIRFITWGAHHDSGVRGLSADQKSELVTWLLKRGQVVASMEGGGTVPAGCVAVTAPEDLHSLLAFSSGYIGEGATMAKEAAVLGVASVFISPFSRLPPIIAMEKTGALVRTDALDLDVVEKALGVGRKTMEMFDVTGEIVRRIVNNEHRK